jgi:Bacteriophage Mu, Gp27
MGAKKSAAGTHVGAHGSAPSNDLPTPAKTRGDSIPRKIQRLPAGLRRQLDNKLATGSFRSYRSLSKWLQRHGRSISHTALSQYSKRFDVMLAAVRLATLQAREVVKHGGKKRTEIDDALIRIVQTDLFNVIVQLNKAQLEPDPEQLHAAVRSVARIEDVRIRLERCKLEQQDRNQKALAKAQAALDAERGRGLSVEGAAQIRAALLEIIDDGEPPNAVNGDAPAGASPGPGEAPPAAQPLASASEGRRG